MSLLIILSAASGTGKSTLIHRLMRVAPGLSFSVSHTTRKPRGQEVDGEDYHFVSRESFESAIGNGEFLEWADVFGNYYGTHMNEWRKARERGEDLLLDIDVQGARQLKERLPEVISIFLLAPSRQTLETRLRARSEDSPEEIQRRLRNAAQEIRQHSRYDYVVVNDDVEKSANDLMAIIRAERLRSARMQPRIRHILDTFGEADSTAPPTDTAK